MSCLLGIMTGFVMAVLASGSGVPVVQDEGALERLLLAGPAWVAAGLA